MTTTGNIHTRVKQMGSDISELDTKSDVTLCLSRVDENRLPPSTLTSGQQGPKEFLGGWVWYLLENLPSTTKEGMSEECQNRIGNLLNREAPKAKATPFPPKIPALGFPWERNKKTAENSREKSIADLLPFSQVSASPVQHAGTPFVTGWLTAQP